MAITAAYLQSSNCLDHTPTAALDAGSVVRLPDGRVGVTPSAIAAGITGTVATDGVYDLAAASGTLFTDGEDVYFDATNKLAVPAGNANANFRFGRAVAAKISGVTSVRALINAVSGLAARAVTTADSAAVTNTVAETVIGTLSIPANSLSQGRVVEFFAGVIATATNSTDTFRFRVRLGGVAGAVIADTTAIDLANSDTGVISGQVVVREDGAAGSIVGAALSTLKTTANQTLLDATALDTTAATTLVLTCTESVASASNSARATLFTASVR